MRLEINEALIIMMCSVSHSLSEIANLVKLTTTFPGKVKFT